MCVMSVWMRQQYILPVEVQEFNPEGNGFGLGHEIWVLNV